MLSDYLLKTKDTPPLTRPYRGNFWVIKDNKLTTLEFASNKETKWEDVPLDSYYRITTNGSSLKGTYVLIGEYCLYCDYVRLSLPSDRFYIKGTIGSNDFTVVPFNASNLLQNTIKRNPYYTCVSDPSQTSSKYHININSDGMFVDFTSYSETKTELCYYASSIFTPAIPLYPGYEVEVSISAYSTAIEFLITSYRLN